MTRTIINYLRLVPSQLYAFIITLFLATISVLSWHFQKYRFMVFICGILGALSISIFTPQQLILLVIWIANVIPGEAAIKTGSIQIRIIEISVILLIGSFIIDIAQIKRVKFGIRKGSIGIVIAIFLTLFFVSAFRGILKDFYGPGFRADFIRGPIYLAMFFPFYHFCATTRNGVEKLVRHTLYASIACVFVFAARSIFQFFSFEEIGAAGAYMGGSNLQVFMFAIGMTFVLGIIEKKRWWVITIIIFLALLYTRTRTVPIGSAFVIIFSIILYSLTLPWKNRIRFLGKSLISISFITLVIAFLTNIFLSYSRFEYISAFVSRMGILLKPTYLFYSGPIRIRFLEAVEALFKLRDSSYLFGEGLGSTFTTMNGLWFIDNLYGMVAVKTGLLGLSVFIFLFFMFGFIAYKLIKNIEYLNSNMQRAFVITSAAAIPSFLIMGTTTAHLWICPGVITTFAAYLAILSYLWHSISSFELDSKNI